MKDPGARMLRLAVPVKVVVQRFAFVLLIAGAFSLMMLGKADIRLVERVRVAVNDAISPVLVVLSHPIAAVHDAVDEMQHLLYLRSENERLSEENARLLRWQSAARRIEQENAAYRALLNAKIEERVSFISARIIGDSGGPFVRTVLLNAGAREGVAKGQAAVTGEGLVGRIVETGERASRILLLTDLNSRIPVVIQTTRQRAVLAGDNTGLPRLEFVSDGPSPRSGERVVTSGHGGLFPPGLPIGVISGVRAGHITVQPYVERDRLEYVRLLRYHVPTLEGEAAPTGARP